MAARYCLWMRGTEEWRRDCYPEFKHREDSMAPLKRDGHHHTYADYLKWSGSSGEELIDGTHCVREPPAPSPLHQEIVIGLCSQVYTALKGKPWRAGAAPFD